MKFLLRIGFLLLVFLNLILASWFVLHQDITFSADIARDFHLLREVDQKKLVLIGPRSSTGLFHGPLWLYLNYPAYLVGHGDPVVVGWFWILLVAAFVVESFLVARALFSPATGYLFALASSLYMVFHAHGMFNPHGAMLLIPLVFFFFVRYWQTDKLRYLCLHWILVGAVVQFQMAIGIPFLLLSLIAVLFRSLQKKNYKPFLLLPLVVLMFGNFIVFDLRHNFLLAHILADFLSPIQKGLPYNYALNIAERFRLMVSSVEILRVDPGYRNFFLTMILLVLIALQIRAKKFTTVYWSFLYFYIGFFVLSIIDKGPLLYFYLFPLFPLVFLIFASMVTSKKRILFLVLFFSLYVMNTQTAIKDIHMSDTIIDRSIYSWKFLYALARDLYKEAPPTFGYFVYSPDVFAYEAKYAIRYAGQLSTKQGASFTKAPTTYLVIAPPPPDNPYMKDEWWRINQVKIGISPSTTVSYPNGYKVETYHLSAKDISVAFDPAIDPGIHFR